MGQKKLKVQWKFHYLLIAVCFSYSVSALSNIIPVAQDDPRVWPLGRNGTEKRVKGIFKNHSSKKVHILAA